jgi:large subunit ribosomal protein L24
MQKLKLNDEVIVLAGKDKGKKGKIIKVLGKQERVIVEGVNMVKKTARPTQANPNGGIVEKEAPLHKSNVSIVDPKTGKASRIKRSEENGKNARVTVKGNSTLK